MKDRLAEACRRNADEAQIGADNADTVIVRIAFQRLAEGYDILAEQLEAIAEDRAAKVDDLMFPPSAPRLPRGRHLVH
jgi:hypothetical protein